MRIRCRVATVVAQTSIIASVKAVVLCVVSPLSGQRVVASEAADQVVVPTTGQPVIVAVSTHRVLAAVSVTDVVAVKATDTVVVGSTMEPVLEQARRRPLPLQFVVSPLDVLSANELPC